MFHALGYIGAKGIAGVLNAGPGLIPPYSARTVSGSVYLAEDVDLLLGVPLERVRIVDKILQTFASSAVGMMRASSTPLSKINW